MAEDQELEAVGVSYREGDSAPVIASISQGDQARAVCALARELGVYVHEDPLLLDELKRLEEGEQVPPQLFEIIAVILSFSYILQGRTPESYTRPDGTRAINAEI